MKRVSLLLTSIAGLLLLAVATPTYAAEQGKDKEITVTGDAKCAMCILHEGDKCQTVIQTEGKDGKKVTYYLADTDAAKGFHDDVCKAAKKVTATGTVKKNHGKMELAVSKIEAVK